jgi:superfamily II DNA or RNA helicase
MLREGWDVPEVSVILYCGKFGSKVYGQQVIGRGLRRVRVKDIKADEPQTCAVVDTPNSNTSGFGKSSMRSAESTSALMTFSMKRRIYRPPAEARNDQA